MLASVKLTRREYEGVSWASMWRTLEPRAFDFVFVKSKRHGVTAEEEGEVVEGAAVVQPQLIEADVVADCGAAAAGDYVTARQNDGMDVVEDLKMY
jgi:hypothetical protein